MNKVTALLDAIATVITNVRILADSLQAASDVLAEFKTAETVEQPVAQILEKAEKAYTLEDVRGVLAKKSQNGLTTEVKALITKFGGSKLSDIDPSRYAEIIKEAEVLGNE